MQYTDIQIWQPGILRNTDYLNPGPAKPAGRHSG